MSTDLIKEYKLEPHEVDRIIGMAWEDRTPFDTIEAQFGLSEKEVIELMRRNLKRKSWERWRKQLEKRDAAPRA